MCRLVLGTFGTIASMNEFTIEELQEQNRVLQILVMSLSATLLREVALELEARRPRDSADAERLVREAEECFRCARITGLKLEIANGLEAAGHELMAQAVEIETTVQRHKRKTQIDGGGVERSCKGHA